MPEEPLHCPLSPGGAVLARGWGEMGECPRLEPSQSLRGHSRLPACLPPWEGGVQGLPWAAECGCSRGSGWGHHGQAALGQLCPVQLLAVPAVPSPVSTTCLLAQGAAPEQQGCVDFRWKKAACGGLCDLSLMPSQGLALPDPRALRWWQGPLDGDKPQKLKLLLCLPEGLLLLFLAHEGFPWEAPGITFRGYVCELLGTQECNN